MILTTVKPYQSTRPLDHGERVRCLEFVDGLRELTLAAVVTASMGVLSPLVVAYVAARKANQTAASIAEKRQEAARLAAAAFDEAFDTWTLKVDAARDEKGYANAHLKAELDGLSLSGFLRRSDWDKVAKMVTLFVHVSENPDLVGDPAAYKALKPATDALREALGARDDADRDVTDASAALLAATKAFDKGYGSLLSLLEDHANDKWKAAPRFRRERKVKVVVPDHGSSSGGSEDGTGDDPTPPATDDGAADDGATDAGATDDGATDDGATEASEAAK